MRTSYFVWIKSRRQTIFAAQVDTETSRRTNANQSTRRLLRLRTARRLLLLVSWFAHLPRYLKVWQAVMSTAVSIDRWWCYYRFQSSSVCSDFRTYRARYFVFVASLARFSVFSTMISSTVLFTMISYRKKSAISRDAKSILLKTAISLPLSAAVPRAYKFIAFAVPENHILNAYDHLCHLRLSSCGFPECCLFGP